MLLLSTVYWSAVDMTEHCSRITRSSSYSMIFNLQFEQSVLLTVNFKSVLTKFHLIFLNDISTYLSVISKSGLTSFFSVTDTCVVLIIWCLILCTVNITKKIKNFLLQRLFCFAKYRYFSLTWLTVDVSDANSN